MRRIRQLLVGLLLCLAPLGAMAQGSFMTPPTIDGTAPVVTSGPTVISITDTSAIIGWTTDEIADSRLDYGVGGLTEFTTDTQKVTNHLVTLTNLTGQTSYSYRVSSTDPSGNTYTGATLSFTTLATPDVTAPTFSTGPTASNLTQTSARIDWTTNEPATWVLNYGTTGGALTSQVAGGSIATAAGVTLTNLTPGTSYDAQVTAWDVAGNQGTSGTITFSTQAATPTYSLSVGITGTGSVASNPGGIDCGAACAANYAAGTTVTLSATPGANYTLDSWTGCDNNPTATSCTVTLSAPRSVQAIFTTSGISYAPSLVPGFNLVGNSLAGPIDVLATFGTADAPTGMSAQIDAVWAWNATTQRWMFHTPQLTQAQSAAYATNNNFEVLATIPAGEGYWVNAYGPVSLPAQAGMPFVYEATLFGARPMQWNLLASGASQTPVQFNQSAGTNPANFESLWAWNPSQSKWYFYSPQLDAGIPITNAQYANQNGFLDFATDARLLDPGTGFWVYRP